MAVVIKIRVSRWGDNPELSKWAQWCNHKGPYKRETRSESAVGDMTRSKKVE